VLTAAGVTTRWALGLATAVAAVVVALGAVWQERYRQEALRQDDLERAVTQGCLVSPSGRLPSVREITDPIRLGVHPSVPVDTEADALASGERVPPYVPRDIDPELSDRLSRSGFVLLVGESTAGKSRSAFEAMALTLADHVLIAPSGKDALGAAVETAVQTKRCVLWLNDLERFLGTGGLTTNQITRMLSAPAGHRLILATLRAAEEIKLTMAREGGDGSGTGGGAGQGIREVLEQAHRMVLRRLFSTAERERAADRATAVECHAGSSAKPDLIPRYSGVLTRATTQSLAE
jgi:hypothetical protein